MRTQAPRTPVPGVAPSQEHVIRNLIIGLNAAPERTGIAPYTSGMAERLAAAGDDVRLITTFPHYPQWCFVDGEPPRRQDEIVNGVAVTRVRHRLPSRGSSVSRVVSELSFGVRALLTRWYSPDAVVLVSPALFASALVVPVLKLRRIPFVVWVQDLYGLGVQETAGAKRPGLLGRLVGALESWVLRQADSLVVIHEHMSAAVLRLGADAERVHVVRNWTHIATTPQTDRDRVRTALGWGRDETVVLHSGNMGTKQDLRNVAYAARLADDRHAPVRFVLMGDGVERPLVEASAEGVERLEVIPPQPAHVYEQMLQAADVLLVNEHPGVREMAFPSKLTSYFASGRPVLAATNEDSTTATELRSSSAGDRVAPGRPAELLDGVLQLAADPDRMRALARAGARYRAAVLTVESASRNFSRVLHELPRRHGGASFESPAEEPFPDGELLVPEMTTVGAPEVIHPVTAELRVITTRSRAVRSGERTPVAEDAPAESPVERPRSRMGAKLTGSVPAFSITAPGEAPRGRAAGSGA